MSWKGKRTEKVERSVEGGHDLNEVTRRVPAGIRFSFPTRSHRLRPTHPYTFVLLEIHHITSSTEFTLSLFATCPLPSGTALATTLLSSF